MFFNIHTHHKVPADYLGIQNLSFPEAEKLFPTQEKGLYSVGLHPWHADEFSNEFLSKLEQWAPDNRLVAIGECGLDKNSSASLELQLAIFRLQIALSESVKKPLIIHCVGCFNELFELKSTLNPNQQWIIHGFRGKSQLAQQALKSGCCLSFGEYFNDESVHVTPLEKLFVETDESTLPIDEIYNRIVAIKSCKPDDLFAGKLFYKQISSLNKG
jgi:TatD DNase family protein